MQIIKQNPVIAAILGGLAVMVLLVAVLSGGGNSGSDLPTSDLPTATGTAFNPFAQATTEAERFPGPDFEQLACGPLLTFEDIDPVLDTTRWLTVGGGETCTHRTVDDASVFVRIGPGHPTDLIDTILDGAVGQPVSEVGDAAVWFSEPATLSVAAESRLGIVVLRITIGRSDLDDPARLEAARTLARAALPRFPGIDAAPAPPPDPVVLSTDHAPVDQADQSYVANLLAREANGDWTRGEGLIATLQLFLGEATNSRVTPARTIADTSGSEIAQLASNYLATDASADEATELERLLARLLPSSDQLAAMSDASNARGIEGPRPIAFATQETSGCETFWGAEDPCITEVISPALDEAFGAGKYKIFAPAEDVENTHGWTDAHLVAAIDALERSALNFEARGTMPANLEIMFTPLGTNRSVGLGDTDSCLITLNTPMQALFAQSADKYGQWIAHEIGRCYARSNFPAGSLDESRWWETGYVWYLSDTVFPNASIETDLLGLPQALAGEELATVVPGRVIGNIAFFESVHEQSSASSVDDMIRAIPAGLDTYNGAGMLTHEFVKVLTDGLILDQGGAHNYAPDADDFELAEGLVIIAEPQPFGVERLHLTVPSGKYACVEYDRRGNVLNSHRPGGPGEGGSWAPPPTTLEGSSTLVATATRPGASVTITVNELSDESDCEEDEEDNPPKDDEPGPSCGFCEPSSFYYDSVEDWLLAIARGE